MARMGVVKVNLQVRHDNLGVVDFYKALDYRDERLTSMGKRLPRADDIPRSTSRSTSASGLPCPRPSPTAVGAVPLTGVPKVLRLRQAGYE